MSSESTCLHSASAQRKFPPWRTTSSSATRDSFSASLSSLRQKQHGFPGNVRELENMIQSMVTLGHLNLTRVSSPVVRESGRDANRAKRVQKPAGSLRAISREAAQAAERSAILKALKQTHWNRLLAAKLLNISYRSLLYKIKEGGLDRKSNP